MSNVLGKKNKGGQQQNGPSQPQAAPAAAVDSELAKRLTAQVEAQVCHIKYSNTTKGIFI